MRKAYFPRRDGAPEPLRITVTRRVRFEEVDPLGIVWHGRYPSFFEDARVALGDSLGVGYMNFHGNGVVAPIRQLQVDYHSPLKYGETFNVTALLHWTDAARMNFEFVVENESGAVTTTGCTVQLFLDLDGELLMTPPDFYREFLSRWERGKL